MQCLCLSLCLNGFYVRDEEDGNVGNVQRRVRNMHAGRDYEAKGRPGPSAPSL